uniref:EOG090X0GXS n=2 Tax=Daphnia TaxID=6668 RepID=A0A4Y7MVA4_DAPPU|nr:EOG090X0GXS [Daphnia pulex]SVE85845.1 EOG090X0GXS [Daphnia pulicaria]
MVNVTKGILRESARQKDANSRRVLDEAARRRRARKALEALEQDNFHDDPHANLVLSKKIPKFEESLDGKQTRRRKSKNFEIFKQRFRKSFAQLLEEEQVNRPEPPNYVSAQVPPSKFPERHFCAVCGFTCSYTCLSCGARYCSVKCLGTHQDTRCLKWTA